MRIEYSVRSHFGLVRGNNADYLYVDGVMLTPDIREYPFNIDGLTDYPAIFAVCDGMGGEAKDEVDSLTVIQMLGAIAGIIKTTDSRRLNETIDSLDNGINEAMHSGGHNGDTRIHTWTTLALVVVTVCGTQCFNQGDLRIYVLHEDEFRQISRDHIPDGNAGNQLTRCSGIGDARSAEAYPTLPLNYRILICSDGLSDMVDAAGIERSQRSSQETANAADYLLNTAWVNGGKDNVTVIFADTPDPKSMLSLVTANKL